jgi:hypothetical protein
MAFGPCVREGEESRAPGADLHHLRTRMIRAAAWSSTLTR